MVSSHSKILIPQRQLQSKMGLFHATANHSILHISGYGWSWKTAQSSKSFSCASRIYWLFRFGPETRASKATTAIPRSSNIVPKLGGCRAILHILGRGLSLEVARSSKLFSFASHIYWLLKFGAATRASKATTAIPCTSEIIPKLGGCRVIIHISGCDWSWKTASSSKSSPAPRASIGCSDSALQRAPAKLPQRSLARRRLYQN
jgi:hypothetical protein